MTAVESSLVAQTLGGRRERGWSGVLCAFFALPSFPFLVTSMSALFSRPAAGDGTASRGTRACSRARQRQYLAVADL
jgi:hypothetical protein